MKRVAARTQTLRGFVRGFAHRGITGATFAVLIVFGVLEILTRRLARIPVSNLDTDFLPVTAIAGEPIVAIVLLAALGWIVWRHGSRIFLRWTDFEHGRQLQLAAGAVMAILVWRVVSGAHNFLFDQWYLADRTLLVILLIAAVLRPAAMLLLVIEVRLLQAPLRAPSFLSPGLNIDELALLVVMVLAAMTLVSIVSERFRASAAALPIMAAAIAAQFFLPGRTKIRARWFDNDIHELPLSGYAQGWLGGGDGAFAQSLSDAISAVEPILVVLTLLFEVGAILMVFRRSFLVTWILAAFGFHLAVLLTIGFVFLEFVVVEAAILLLVSGASGRKWSRPAFAAGPSLIAAAAVVLGPWIFHPPTLVWFDTNLTYAFEVEATDISGEKWDLVPGDFAPFDDAMAFSALELGPTIPLVGAYGAASRSARTALTEIASLEDLAAAETVRGSEYDADRDSEALALLQRFLESTHQEQGDADWLPRPPDHFQIGRPGRSYDFEVPLELLLVEMVTTIRIDGEDLVRRERVALIEMRGEQAVVISP